MGFKKKVVESIVLIIILTIVYLLMSPIYVAIYTNEMLRTGTITIDIIILSLFLLALSLLIIYVIHEYINNIKTQQYETPLKIEVKETQDLP